MTILSCFTLIIPIRPLWINLYHKEDHFLKICSLLHYFSEIYLKIWDVARFFKKKCLPTQKKPVLIPYTAEKGEVSLANSLELQLKLSDKLLIQTNKRKWSKNRILWNHSRPFKTTLSFLSFWKSINNFDKFPVTPFCFYLKIRSVCQTLSKALEISRKMSLTSKPLSKTIDKFQV